VEPQTHCKSHLVYQHHPFARKIVNFQHFLTKQPMLEVHFPWVGKVPGPPAIQMKVQNFVIATWTPFNKLI
jgi:hypothetical protein